MGTVKTSCNIKSIRIRNPFGQRDDTVGEVLAEAGIEVTEHDVVSPGLQEQLGEDNSITVQKAFEVTLNDGGEEKKVWSTSTTVADFLKRENIQLNDDDRLE